MRKTTIHILLVFVLSLPQQLIEAQKNHTYFSSNTAEQLGYGLKFQVELGGKSEFLKWRLGLSCGAGSFLIKDILYPSLQADIMLYHGGIGSRWPGEKKKGYLDIEMIIGYTVTVGAENRMKFNNRLSPQFRNYPLYYFNTFTVPSIQNPYNYSLSWGGNVVFLFTRPKTKFQQVGFLNIHVDRFQFSYANDGPPFSPPFGDKFDRLHTGIGFISLHGNTDWPVDMLEVGFNKFTGYSKNTYELGNKIGTAYNYYEEQQQYYNKSNFYYNLTSTTNNWFATLNLYNYTELDIQHKIHQNLFYPLHMVPYKGHTVLGGGIYYNHNKIGFR